MRKTLKFDRDYTLALLAGYKTATVRYEDDKDLSAGDELDLADPDGNVWGEAVVEQTAVCLVEEAPEVAEAIGGRLSHTDPDELATALNGHYDDPITLGDPVKVVALDPETIRPI